MITSVTLGWQKPGRLPKKRRFPMPLPVATTERAFEIAVERLKSEMIEDIAMEHALDMTEGDGSDRAAFYAQVGDVLRLRPFAHDYGYTEGR